MKISEIYYSIQGEGKLAGVPSVFIRTSGCNLRCHWCDTPYASWKPEGDSLSPSQVLDRVTQYATRYVVLTGGEPMIAPGVEELTRRLKSKGYHLTIETAGTVWKDVVCDLASVSPKLKNATPWKREEGRWADAHEAARINVDVLRRFAAIEEVQFKFVVDAPDDLTEIDDLLKQINHLDPADVLLMPQGVTAEELSQRGRWLAELCKERNFRFCPRLHILMYGHTRGT